ncbi:hypothetical protein BH11BAC3_BH11BAC3_26120 [soil metagenome]
MANLKPASFYMRILHRYIGFFLAGIMAVYSLSGIVLIFRDTNFLKREKLIGKTIMPNLKADELGKIIKIRDLKFNKTEGDIQYFVQGNYNGKTGFISYTTRELPRVLTRLTQLHKASTTQPLFFLNIFFGVSLFFFVISSFWMFRPETKIFKKGMYFVIAGIVLTLILLFV